jgi:FtsH ternary system domain X7
MLERIAVHQTRLRVPGIGLDARGIALGARGLVLLPSLDRLIAFLAVYTEEQSLGAIVESLEVQVVKSRLNTREIALSFEAGSSDRMDRVGEVARLAGGFTFTGTSRHFVQYRDAAAPFGYDSPEVSSTDAALALYHSTFSQTYDVERPLELRSLLLRLMPHPDPKAEHETRGLFVLAEAGLGPSLLGYFTRSAVSAAAGICEWPPESSFDTEPVRRWLFRVENLPQRMLPLLMRTPGISAFAPVTPGAAVELGYRHPISLAAVPVFAESSLTLFRGRGEPALELPSLPALGDVRALGRAEVSDVAAQTGRPGTAPPNLGVPLKLAPDVGPPTTVAAILVAAEDLPMLRRLAYALGADVIGTTRFAATDFGVFLLRDAGIEALPVGTFYRRIHPNVFVPAGWRVVPQVPPDVVFQSLGAPADRAVFFWPNGQAAALPLDAFVPLETALCEGHSWAPVAVEQIENVFAEEVPTVWLESLGISPLKGATVA